MEDARRGLDVKFRVPNAARVAVMASKAPEKCVVRQHLLRPCQWERDTYRVSRIFLSALLDDAVSLSLRS